MQPSARQRHVVPVLAAALHSAAVLQVQQYKLARAGHVAQLNAAGRAAAQAAGVPFVDMALMSAAFHSPIEYLKVTMPLFHCCTYTCTVLHIMSI